MDAEAKQQLIEQFRELLDSPGFNASHALKQDQRDVDLFDVFSELIAIKTELRIQGRQFKSALDQLSDAHTSNRELLDDNQQLLLKSQHHQQLQVIEDLLEIRDRIANAVVMSGHYQPGAFALIARHQERKLIKSLHDGQQLTLERLDQLLSSLQVKPIQTLGKPFNPDTMCAIEVSHDDAFDNHVVSRQISAGYCWQDRVIRAAQVIVNRL